MPRLFLRVLSEATPHTSGVSTADVTDAEIAIEDYDVGVEWLIAEDDGSVRGAGVTDYRGLSDIADPNLTWLADPDNTVVFLPSQFVLTLSCEVPGKTAAQMRRGLPFTVEEFVATDIEDMHIAHGNVKPNTPVMCNIVAHEVLANWLACFRSLQVNPGYFIADSQVLPNDAGLSSVLFEGDMALVVSEDQAATVDRGNLVFALNSLNCQTIHAINGTLSDLECGQLENNPEIEEVAVSEFGILEYLANQYPSATFINLLQGPYQPRRPQSEDAIKWRGVMALAAGWLVVAFIAMVVQGWWAGSSADQLQAESFAIYKRAFPRESQPNSVEQLRRRMQAKVGKPTQDDGSNIFVGLTAQLSNVLEQGSKVDSLIYSSQRQELTVEVMLGGYDDLDVIKEKLAGSGVAVEVVSSEIEDAGARSRLRVRYES